MLRAADIWFGYDERTPVLRGVSLSVPAAGIVGILGPNGSGKTTLLRMLAGTRRPQRGVVTLDEARLDTLSRAALARRMAVVPQETQLAFDYTVAEVAMMGRYPHLAAFEIEGPRDIAVVEETLASTGTLHLKDRLFTTLSGGEKQRVVIAAALAQISRGESAADVRPNRSFRLPAEGDGYLLLDEPTASLDLGYQLEVVALLEQLHEERRVAIVISTHDLGLAGTLCETLTLIRDGAVVAAGPTDEVLTSENVRTVFGVEADVIRHASGQRVVVPIRRTDSRGRG
ncbi:MAG TPA: ABC transporter ATP-binding protein [Vicinamibacterales bacterium]|nr:ABC transporter ATP-binding protein [Vicinamibacterales bacterium]